MDVGAVALTEVLKVCPLIDACRSTDGAVVLLYVKYHKHNGEPRTDDVVPGEALAKATQRRQGRVQIRAGSPVGLYHSALP